MKTLAERKNRKGERGSVLAISALSMLGLLLATGLAVDISHLYTAKAELQNAADASALAAASQLNSTSGGIKSAVYQAKLAMNEYDFNNSITLNDSDVTFARNLNDPTYMSAASAELTPSTIRFVKVTIPPKPVGIAFSAAVLGSTTNVAATATAGLSVGLTMNKFYTAYTFIESSAAPITKGSSLILDAKAGNSNSPTSYRVLQGPSGDLITTGTIHAYGEVGESYTVANLSQAEMCRYARIGVNTRFGDYSTSLHPNINPTDEPPDQFTEETLTYKDYTDKQGTNPAAPGVKNRRVMTLPIAMNTTYNTGSRTVVANRLGAFFIKKKVDTDCKLHVEFIGAPIAVPVGTFDPNGAGVGDLSIPVLYK